MLGVEAATYAAWATVATLAVYIGLFLYAVKQVGEARKLREEQTRPFVVAEFVPDFLITFRVRNIGATLARNVKVTWDRWPEVTKTFAQFNLWSSPQGSALFNTGIPCLAPGQDVSTHFDHFPNRVDQGLPMTYRVTVDYDNYEEDSAKAKHYSLTYILDLDLYKDLRTQRPKGLRELVAEIQDVKKLMTRWSDDMTGDLKVSTRNRDRYNAREFRPIKVDKIRTEYREHGLPGAARYVVTEVRRKYGLHGWGNL